jgi:hypothetical protein
MAILASCLLTTVLCSAAPTHLSVDSGECGEDTPIKETIAKSLEFLAKARQFKAYGEMSFRRMAGAHNKGCHVVYTLFVSSGNSLSRKRRKSPGTLKMAK